MPKARKLGKYLKAADLGGSKGTYLVQLMDAGERAEPSDYRPDGALEIPVTPHTPPEWATEGNEPKTWSLNRTSEDTLRDQIGEDSEDWVDKLVRINVSRQKVMGTMRDILYADEEHEPQERAKERGPPKAAPTTAPKKVPEPRETPTAETPIFSEVTTLWLRYNETLIGGEVEAPDYNNMSKTAKDELWNAELLYAKDDLFYLKPEAKQLLE